MEIAAFHIRSTHELRAPSHAGSTTHRCCLLGPRVSATKDLSGRRSLQLHCTQECSSPVGKSQCGKHCYQMQLIILPRRSEPHRQVSLWPVPSGSPPPGEWHAGQDSDKGWNSELSPKAHQMIKPHKIATELPRRDENTKVQAVAPRQSEDNYI